MKPYAWPGILVATVGTGLAAWAFTGDRSYHIEFVLVVFGGMALIGVGSWWAARNRARQARLGAKAAAQAKEKAAKPEPAPTRYTLECPNCSHLFELTTGNDPSDATCPSCGHSGAVVPPPK